MTLSKAHKAQLCVGLVRKGYRPEEVEGVILDLSSHWCQLASLESFDPDGYWIVRRDTIQSARFRRFEAFRHEILLSKGVIARLKRPRGIDLSTTDSVFTSLTHRRCFAIVYRETEAEWWSLHSAVLGHQGGNLLLHGFDGAGRFESRTRRYPCAEITCIRFGSRYLREYQTAAPYDFRNRRPIIAD